MKNPFSNIRSIFLLSFLLFGSTRIQCQIVPSWGFFPQIGAASTGTQGVFQLSATNYLNQALIHKTVSNVSSYKNDEGVFAWIENSTIVYFTTFDVTRNAFVTDNSVSTAIGSIIHSVSDGVVLYWDGYQLIAAIYDPIAHSWKRQALNTGWVGTFVNGEGIISWLVNPATWRSATYDPSLRIWVTTMIGIFYSTPFHENGMVWWTSGSEIGTAFYDYDTNNWNKKIRQNPANQLVTGSGMAAWRENAQELKVSALDLPTKTWNTSGFAYTGYLRGLSLAAGTLYFEDDLGIHRYGFAPQTMTWEENAFTKPACEIFVFQPNNAGPSTAFVTSRTVGGQFFGYEFGDNSTATRRSTFHQYQGGGNFTIRQELPNFQNPSGCSYEVTVTGPTATIETETRSIGLYPNPLSVNQNLNIASEYPMTSVKLITVQGKLIFTQKLSGKAATMALGLSNLAAGIYFLEVQYADKKIVREKLILR